MLTTSYTLSATTPLPFADAVGRARTELKTEGFGVLCEIDVQATLREKLGVEGEPYLILGACNPPLAQRSRPSPTSASCCPATSSSTNAAARHTSPRSTPKGCSRSSTTTTSAQWQRK